MATEVVYTNKDGLTRRFGVQDKVDRPRVTQENVKRTLVLDFTYADVTGAASTGFYDADASGGDTPDSFSNAVPYIPANSVITNAYIVATSAWTGTATVDIGFESQDGTALDADALFDGLDVDSATVGLANAGAAPLPNGVSAQNTTGTYDPDNISDNFSSANMYVRPINADAGTLTAGAARLVVEYIEP